MTGSGVAPSAYVGHCITGATGATARGSRGRFGANSAFTSGTSAVPTAARIASATTTRQ